MALQIKESTYGQLSLIVKNNISLPEDRISKFNLIISAFIISPSRSHYVHIKTASSLLDTSCPDWYKLHLNIWYHNDININ